MRSNIEKAECHEWLEDASRLADKIGATVSVPRITGRQEHRNNALSVNPESHYRVNVAIPYIAHLLEEMSSRFSEDIRAEAEIFSFVPSAVVKHGSLRKLAEKLQFGNRNPRTPCDVEKDDKNASKPVAKHVNLPNHSKQHMVVCGLSLHQGSTESCKTLEQKFIFQIGTLNPHGINERFSFS